MPEVWRNAFLRDDVDGDTKRLLQIGAERHQIEGIPTLRHLDKQVDVAGGTGFAVRDRAEHPNVPRAVGRSIGDGVPIARRS